MSSGFDEGFNDKRYLPWKVEIKNGRPCQNYSAVELPTLSKTNCITTYRHNHFGQSEKLV